jgi:3-hydroxybutyryl-CoA dehydrogenase
MTYEIKKIGVVGIGLMGSGIAHIGLAAGHDVAGMEPTDDLLKAGTERLRKSLKRQAEKQNWSEEQFNGTMARFKGATSLDNFADCDIVIEAITENVDEKKNLFAALDRIAKPSAIFASNTSSIPIANLAAAVGSERRKQFIGLHHFNPVPVMKLVELVKTEESSDEVVRATRAWEEAMGKGVIECKDTPAFVVNALLVPYILGAIRMYQNGVASKEDIDRAMKWGTNFPMGPFELLDFVGLDTTLYIADIMFNETKEVAWAAPSLLRRLVSLGYTGRKAGRGFYSYK